MAKLDKSLSLLKVYSPESMINHYRLLEAEQSWKKEDIRYIVKGGVRGYTNNRWFKATRRKLALQYYHAQITIELLFSNGTEYLFDVNKIFNKAYKEYDLEEKVIKLLKMICKKKNLIDEISASDVGIILDTLSITNIAIFTNLTEEVTEFGCELNAIPYKRESDFINCKKYLEEGIEHLEGILVKKLGTL